MSFQARRAGVRTPFCRQVEAKSPQSSYNGGALEGWKLFWPPVHRIPNPIDGSMSNWIHAHVGGVQRPCFWRVAFAPQRDTKRTSPHTHTHTHTHLHTPRGLRAPVAPVAPMEPPVASPPVSRPETRPRDGVGHLLET